MLKLPMMKNATDMLVIGEDLGMIPACVPDVMNALSIIGMRIQRMPVSKTLIDRIIPHISLIGRS